MRVFLYGIAMLMDAWVNHGKTPFISYLSVCVRKLKMAKIYISELFHYNAFVRLNTFYSTVCHCIDVTLEGGAERLKSPTVCWTACCGYQQIIHALLAICRGSIADRRFLSQRVGNAENVSITLHHSNEFLSVRQTCDTLLFIINIRWLIIIIIVIIIIIIIVTISHTWQRLLTVFLITYFRNYLHFPWPYISSATVQNSGGTKFSEWQENSEQENLSFWDFVRSCDKPSCEICESPLGVCISLLSS